MSPMYITHSRLSSFHGLENSKAAAIASEAMIRIPHRYDILTCLKENVGIILSIRRAIVVIHKNIIFGYCVIGRLYANCRIRGDKASMAPIGAGIPWK